MDRSNDTRGCWVGRLRVALFAFVSTCVPVAFIANAVQGQPPQEQTPSQSPALQELRAKYRIDAASVPQGAAGPAGPFFISGDLTPRSSSGIFRSTGVAQQIAAARQLIAEERSIFGIADVNQDLVERSTQTDDHAQVHIAFDRRVSGLQLEGMEVLVHFDGSGRIVSVNGTLVPVEESVAHNVNRILAGPVLDRAAAQEVVRLDLGLTKDEMSRVATIAIKRVALPASPYVAWKVNVRGAPRANSWSYLVDAVSGKVLQRKSEVYPVRSNVGGATSTRE